MLTTLAGCSTSPSQEQAKVVKIGVIAPLSGPAANYGEEVVKAYEYAADQFNQSTTKYQIQLVVEDGKCSGKDSTSAAQKLITFDNVAYIIGGVCSSETIAASDVAKQYKMSVISPTASAAELSKKENVFRFRSDDLIGKSFGNYITTQADKLAIVSENTDYAVGITNNVKQSYTGTVVNDIHFNSEEKDFDMIVKQLDLSKINGLLFVGQSDESVKSFFRSLSKMPGFAQIQSKIFTPYFCSSESMRAALSWMIEGMRCIDSPAVQDMNQEGKAFLDMYKKAGNIPAMESRVVFSKEVIDLLGIAILHGNTTPKDIESFLKSYTQSNPRQWYVGTYYFDANGDAQGLKYILQKIENNSPVVIQ